MITRVWHGWTDPEDADTYERMLKTRIFPDILSKRIEGLHHIELYRRRVGAEVEFMVIMRFEDADSVRQMTGGTQSAAYVPDMARTVLKRFESTARHFETCVTLSATPRPSHV